MRVLFVSGAWGGSLQSTTELARRLAARDHTVLLLQRARGGRYRSYVHKRAINLRVKVDGRVGGRVIDMFARRIGRRTTQMSHWAVPRRDALLVENAHPRVIAEFRPDVVVVSSIDRMAWRKIRDELEKARIPSVLYLRELTAQGHFTVSNAPAGLHVANAEVFAAATRAKGYECLTIPSVVDFERCRIATTRERVLFVNPIEAKGLAIALGVARARPGIRFAFAESWLLSKVERAALDAELRSLPNVEFRPRVDDPAQLYRDASVLLAPYVMIERPRVVLEAQSNGIPVLASDVAPMRETVGPGGVMVDLDASVDVWCEALDAMLEPATYERLVAEARAYAARPEVDPEHLASMFEQAIAGLLSPAA